MAEKEITQGTDPPVSPPCHASTFPPYVEVKCKSSGKRRRFAAGTEAGFAVSVINRKLDAGQSLAFFIEAVKQGEEEPICFGPNSVLVDYGDGWSLQTVTLRDGVGMREFISPPKLPFPSPKDSRNSNLAQRSAQPVMSLMYIGKILLAFVFIFVIGAIFTLFLENLPKLVLFINSAM
ncbi:hypothetical protein RJ641_027437 [Dillenia turbinata]|uniref:Uncharacterized protein n=1 Tax=Dillenia turbinata TaxID=194707 RepID=A0AAN8ZQC3_9MAGN